MGQGGAQENDDITLRAYKENDVKMYVKMCVQMYEQKYAQMYVQIDVHHQGTRRDVS